MLRNHFGAGNFANFAGIWPTPNAWLLENVGKRAPEHQFPKDLLCIESGVKQKSLKMTLCSVWASGIDISSQFTSLFQLGYHLAVNGRGTSERLSAKTEENPLVLFFI